MSTEIHSLEHRTNLGSLDSLAQEQLHHPPSLIYPVIGPPSFPSRPGSFVQIDCRLESSLTERCAHRKTRKWSTDAGRCPVTIDILSDVALSEIFNCYVNQAREEGKYPLRIQAWHTLVHMCRKWRTIALESPRRLDLQLLCMEKTPVKETLAVWPPLPIVIWQDDSSKPIDNIIVALEHNDRVCQIYLFDVSNSQMEEVLGAMQQPFPALTDLMITLEDGIVPVIPESFLGGSAPHLQNLRLDRTPFLGLPKLLLSATGLTSLHIQNIPHSGYMSPEAMVRCLSTLTRLKTLWLQFESPLSRPVQENRRPHPPTRPILLALTEFSFQGVSEYLEDLVARIDAPLLDRLNIRFFHQLTFGTPQLAHFLTRTPKIQPPVEARILFSNRCVQVMSPRTFLRLTISCTQSDWQLSSLTQVCSSSFPEAFIPTVEHLSICELEFWPPPRWQDDIEDSQWLEVLGPFTAVKYLYLSQEFAPHIAPALQELAGEVLPSLQNIFLKEIHPPGPVREAIDKLVAARQLAGHPIAVSQWDGK